MFRLVKKLKIVNTNKTEQIVKIRSDKLIIAYINKSINLLDSEPLKIHVKNVMSKFDIN